MSKIAVVVSNDNQNVTVIETIDSIVKSGFKDVFIQWYDKDFDVSQEKQLEYIKEMNLNVIFAHLGYSDINNIWYESNEGEELVDKYIRNIDECKKNNISLIVMHLVGGTKENLYNEIGLNRIKKICEYAKQNNIKVTFENTEVRGYLEYIMKNIKDDNVGICLDVGHLHKFFDDDLDFTPFVDRVFAVHLHDNDKSDDLHLIPYDGTINWNFVIDILKKCNYKGDITLESCYKSSYRYITLDEFYKRCYEVALKLEELYNEE